MSRGELIPVTLVGSERITPYASEWGAVALHNLVVDGLEIPGQNYLSNSNPYQYNPDTEITCHLPQREAEGLYDFYERYKSMDNHAFYDCHTAVEFIKGWVRPIDDGMYAPDYQLAKSSIEKMKAGRGYELGHGKTPYRHSILATDTPRSSLSVLDYRGDLILASVDQLMQGYGTHKIQRLTRRRD